MTDNELLLGISDILDKKLKPIDRRLNEYSKKLEVVDERLKKIELRQENDILPRLQKIELRQENDILPRLQNIEACYTSTYDRYRAGVEQIDTMQSDINIMKNVMREHSEKLRKIS